MYWFLISHRLCIAERALKEGWDVYVACQDSGRSEEIKKTGVKFIDLSFSRSGTSIKEELRTLLKFYRVYKDIRPNIVHHVTLKPVIYGSVISRLLKIRGTVNAISGLGYNFTGERKGLVQKMMIRMMKFGFNQENLSIIFQNEDDFKEIKKLKIIRYNFIRGSRSILISLSIQNLLNFRV